MPELTAPERFVPDPENAVDRGVWAGAEADYDRWKAVGPIALPDLAVADVYIAKVFTDRARLILEAALAEMAK